MKRLKLALFNIWVALNMLICAIVFAPFKTLTRETISGFIGRKALTTETKWRRDIWIFFAKAIDILAFDRGHCGEAMMAEVDAYTYLYPDQRMPEVEVAKGIECGQTLEEAIRDSLANGNRLH